MILGVFLPMIAGALGLGGGDSDSSAGGGQKSDPLLDEIKGLRNDIQSQPIQIVQSQRVCLLSSLRHPKKQRLFALGSRRWRTPEQSPV